MLSTERGPGGRTLGTRFSMFDVEALSMIFMMIFGLHFKSDQDLYRIGALLRSAHRAVSGFFLLVVNPTP
jgi:hypothetical protein